MADTAIHGRRNLIINGAMQVSQRVGDSSSSANNYDATPDRIRQEAYGAASPSFQRVTDAPTGFKHSLKLTCAGTTAPTSGNTLRLMTGLEGQDVAHLSYGTAQAKKATLSFHVKASETGTYSVAFVNIAPSGNITSNVTRSFIKTYTVNSADTWEYKTLTFDGCPDGTWGSSNSDGITIVFDLGSGSDHQGTADTWLTTSDTLASGQVTLGDSNGGTWQITGIQLEVGSQATPFEHRSFGEELALCQRYYERIHYSSTVDYDPYGTSGRVLGAGVWYSASTVLADFQFRTTKRATAAVSVPDSSSILAYVGSNGRSSTDATPFDLMRQNNARINASSWSVNGTLGDGAMVQLQDNKYVEIDAEL